MGRLIVGAMSGTSADGVDVALVTVTGRGVEMTARFVAHHHRPYEARVREALFTFRSGCALPLSTLAHLTLDITQAHAKAVNDALAAAKLRSGDVAAVAAHGQTMFHAPPLTVQILDPALLAGETGCTVVSDFRRADCAAGGQGAPLVPFADYVLFRHPARSRVLLNIGGIANFTFIPAGASIEDVVAFDTGPGNCISDWLCRKHEAGGPGYDTDGAMARRGGVIQPAVGRAMEDPYFAAPPPKSTDGPAMIALFERCLGPRGHDQPLHDLLATAVELTARSIALALPKADEVFATGGGVHNRALMENLERRGIRPLTIRDAGADFDGAAKEAVAFALLGAATLDGVPSNVPSATGAWRKAILGSITPNL